jgi:hypothetical protein
MKRSQWNALLADIERQLEQQRSIRPRRLVLQAIVAAVVLFCIGGGCGALAVHLLHGNENKAELK